MKSNRYIILPIAAISLICIAAETARNDNNLPANYPSGNKIIRISTGGMIWQPFTGTGRLSIVNKQTDIAQSALELIKPAIMEETHINIVFENENNRGALCIIVEDVETNPALTIFPEENLARVNIRPLKAQGISSEKLAARVRKEILRAFAYIAGGATSPAAISLMGKVSTPSDLDLLREVIPNEVEMRFPQYLEKIGVKPYRSVPYRLACEEGWAPAPTNDLQKAIWDKVHEPPKTPMKIEFDPKKGR